MIFFNLMPDISEAIAADELRPKKPRRRDAKRHHPRLQDR